MQSIPNSQFHHGLLGAGDNIMVVTYTVSGSTFTSGKPQVWAAKAAGGVDAAADRQLLVIEARGFDAAADGRRLVIARTETTANANTASLTVVQNYFAELRARFVAAGDRAQ
jgi:hypothetical protein